MNENMKPIPPFKFFTMTNFPFIADDFDQMTNYGMFCKIVEYLNKVIKNSNIQNENINSLYQAFLELKNWFDTLDVQEEVNNKLDEMADSGELTEIIAQYLSLAGVFGYDTILNLSEAENLIAGSICRVLGQNTYNDGKGAFYRVRRVTTEDIIDGYNIVAIQSDITLIAERLPDYTINQILSEINNINIKLDYLENINLGFLDKLNNGTSQKLICLGDSLTYGQDGNNPSEQLTTLNYPYLLQQFFNEWYGSNVVTVQNMGTSGQQSSWAVTNYNTIKNNNPDSIIWGYGTNDLNNNVSIEQIIKNFDSFVKKCNEDDIEVFCLSVPPIYKDSDYRRKAHESLSKTLEKYCEKNNIVYFNLFNHIENIYNSMAYGYMTLQPDGTHFSTYKPFSDLIIAKLLNASYIQKEENDFIIPDRNYGYTQYNGGRASNQTEFYNDTLVNYIGTTNPYFYLNVFCKANSKLELLCLHKNTCGIGKFNIDGNNYNVNCYDEDITQNVSTAQRIFTFPMILSPRTTFCKNDRY